MGLDMTLNKHIYIGSHYDHNKICGTIDISRKEGRDGTILKLDRGLENLSEIVYNVMDWRKANAIHKWFVDNVQGGDDNCGTYWLDKSSLLELVDVCKSALRAIDKAKPTKTRIQAVMQPDGLITEEEIAVYSQSVVADILPPTEGFFFGNNDIDEYYIYDLKRTIEVLEEELATENHADYYYHASW